MKQTGNSVGTTSKKADQKRQATPSAGTKAGASKPQKAEGVSKKKQPATSKSGKKVGKLSGYTLFIKEERPKIKGEFNKATEVTKELGRRWKAMTAEEKEKYNERAKATNAEQADAESSDVTKPIAGA